MSDKSDTSASTSKAALTDAAIGSTAIAAALLYGSRRKEREDKHDGGPTHPEHALETD